MAGSEAPLRCAACGCENLKQDEDVLDTWFSSWLWTFSPLGWPEKTPDLQKYHPTTVMVTAADIIFFWVARMVMASYEFLGEKPFGEVLFTGIVRDEQGRKMSKSLGNSPDPIDLIDEFGADALRCSLVMLTPTGADILFSDATLEGGPQLLQQDLPGHQAGTGACGTRPGSKFHPTGPPRRAPWIWARSAPPNSGTPSPRPAWPACGPGCSGATCPCPSRTRI